MLPMLPEYEGQRQELYNQGNIIPMKCGGRYRRKKKSGVGGCISGLNRWNRRGGGFVDPSDQLTEYSGPLHDSTQGGIPLGEHTMVEGGENRTKDIIHSDLPITKDMVREFGRDYGGAVPITMADVKGNRSVADKMRIEDRAFDKYYGDRWNEASRRMMHIPFEQMSEMLGMRRDAEYEDYGDYNEYGKGGRWIQKATASIKRRGTKGKCTPITKPGCTGRAKALAKTFKKMARKRKRKQGGGEITSNQAREIARSGYEYFPTEDVGTIANYLGSKEFGPYSHLQFDNPNSAVYKDLDRISREGDRTGLDRYINELRGPLSKAPVFYRDILEERSLSKRPGTKMLKKRQGGGRFNIDDAIYYDIPQLWSDFKEEVIQPTGRGIRAGAEEIAEGIRDIGYDIREQFPALDKSKVYPGMPTPEDELRYTKTIRPLGMTKTLKKRYPEKKPTEHYKRSSPKLSIIGEKQGGGRFGRDFWLGTTGGINEAGDYTPGTMGAINTALGFAPLLGEAINIGRTRRMRRDLKPVKYPRVGYKPYTPKPVSPTEALSESERAYRSASGQMRQLNPRAYKNRAIQLATAAGRQGAGIRQRYDTANIQRADRAGITNARNRLYADMRNAEIGRMEQIDTRRDEALLDSASGMHISNLFTQAGQVERDMASRRANEGFNVAFFDNLKKHRGFYDLDVPGSGTYNPASGLSDPLGIRSGEIETPAMDDYFTNQYQGATLENPDVLAGADFGMLYGDEPYDLTTESSWPTDIFNRQVFGR
jgi:hypothetical protein